MAQIPPRTTFGGKPVAWLFPLTTNADGEIDGTGTLYSFNHLQTLTPAMASAAGAAAAGATYVEEPAADGIKFRIAEVTELRNAITGAEESASGGGGGNAADKITVVSLATDPLLDVNVIKAMRDEPVLIAIPHGKNYVGGTTGTQGYYVMVGNITSIGGPEFAGNTQSKLTIEVTGGTSYTSDPADGTELEALVFTAIKPAGSDDALAGIAGPTLTGLGAALLTGEIQIL